MSSLTFWKSRSYQRLPTSTLVSPKQRPASHSNLIASLIILGLSIVIICLLRILLRPLWKPLDDYQIMNPLPVAQTAWKSLPPIPNDRAVVTTLYSDNFAIAAAVLGHSILSVNSTARLIILYIDGQVSEEALCISKAGGWEPIAVPRIAPPHGDKSVYSRFVDQYTKLNLWGLDRHGIKSVVYLDGDTLVRRNFDELFDLPFNFAAVPDVYGPKDPRGFSLSFNAGVMALKTSSAALTHMKSMIGRARYPTGEAEQAFLNVYFASKAARLPYIYNANLAIKRRNLAVWKELSNELSIIHYTLWKPFLASFKQPNDKILSTEETEAAVDRAQTEMSDWAEEFEWWRDSFRQTMDDKGESIERCRTVCIHDLSTTHVSLDAIDPFSNPISSPIQISLAVTTPSFLPATTMSEEDFHLLDKESLEKIILAPPFIPVEGIVNLRDALPSKPSSIKPGHVTKPLYLFRSGEPAKVTEEGKAQLSKLGIKKVFDLRSESEVKEYQAPALQIEGVEVIKCPILKDEAFDPVSLAERLTAFGTDEVKAFTTLYLKFLKAGGKSLGLVLAHIRDNPGEPCLIHCTAGKDRTGVFVAVIQMLLGVDEDAIVADYELTTYGLQPLLPLLVKRFQANEVYRNNWKGALNLGTAKLYYTWSRDAMSNMSSERVVPLDPFRTVELAIEVQVERAKAVEALAARDNLVYRLADAYTLLAKKNTAMEASTRGCVLPLADATNTSHANTPTTPSTNLEVERKNFTDQFVAQQALLKQLQDEIKVTKSGQKLLDLPPRYEENMSPSILHDAESSPSVRACSESPALRNFLSPPPLSRSTSHSSMPLSDIANNDNDDSDPITALPKTDNAAERIRARNAILAALPLPLNSPPDDLQPIMIPAPFTLQEFINSGSNGYHLFTLVTLLIFNAASPTTVNYTSSRPLGAMNKKNTDTFSPPSSSVVQILGWSQPTAGTPLTFYTRCPSRQTTSAIVKDTILARRNSSPQNVYEVAQLYACGALKVACVGLQCVGFNTTVFHALVDHANKYAQAALSAKRVPSAPCSRTSTPLHSPLVMTPPINGFPWTSNPLPCNTPGLSEKMASLSVCSPTHNPPRV
ncbi:hypothetical protein ONZ45_g9531 [Pleurotus djamor]|nr:hypothetical protein ONZ45_g9531 [Pleurotus djamor]